MTTGNPRGDFADAIRADGMHAGGIQTDSDTTDKTALGAATRWRLDPAHSTVEFSVPHFWGLVRSPASC